MKLVNFMLHTIFILIFNFKFSKFKKKADIENMTCLLY